MVLPTWFPELKDVVLFALALWGAALSTVNWWKASKRDQRQLKIHASTAMFAGDTLGAPHAQIKATNIGHRAVTVTSLWFELPGGAKLVSRAYSNLPGMTDTPLPASLSDGQSASLWLSYHDIGATLINQGLATARLIPACEDSAGQVHRGAAWNVNAREFVEMGNGPTALKRPVVLPDSIGNIGVSVSR